MAKLILFAGILLLAPWAVLVYASAPPPPDCNSVISQMIDCVDFVLDGSKETKPSSDCCAGLKTVVGVSPTCLCQALETAVHMGYEVNMTRAGALTETCNVDAPGFNGCGGASPPAPAPAPAPALSSPSPAPAPSGSSPAAPLLPPLPTPEPPVSAPPSPVPSPALPVSPPLPSQPSPAPEIPPVGSPTEAEAPSSVSDSASAPTPLRLIAAVAAAAFGLFLAV